MADDLIAYFHNILKRQKDYFCQLLNVYGINVGQTEIHISEPLSPQCSCFETEIVTERY